MAKEALKRSEFLSGYVFSKKSSSEERWAHIEDMAKFVGALFSKKRMGNPCSIADLARARLIVNALPENEWKHCVWCIREERNMPRFALAGLSVCKSHAHDALDQKVKMT